MDLTETRFAQRLRNADLPHSLRGFDEAATRKLLAEAAAAFEKACEQRDQARGEAHVAKEQTADAEAVGRALLTATAAGEQIVASAQEEAAQMIEEVKAKADSLLAEAHAASEQMEAAREGLHREREAERQRLTADRQEVIASARAECDRKLAEAHAEADRLVGEARAEAARLRQEMGEVAGFLESKRGVFGEAVQAALEQLERLDAPTGEELVSDLHPGSAG